MASCWVVLAVSVILNGLLLGSASPSTPTRLRVAWNDWEGGLVAHPIDDVTVSWEVPFNASSCPRGDGQTGYQVICFPSHNSSGVVLDTGRVNSTATAFDVPPSVLAHRTQYSWAVRVWTAGSGSTPSAWSTNSSFHTGVEDGFFDSAGWIGGFNQLRTSFHVSKADVKHAYMYATGLGVFVASVNGQRTTSSSLNPGQTVYPRRVLYTTSDVTGFVQDGENVVGVELGSGKYGYLNVYCNMSGLGPVGCRSARLRLVVTMTNGSEVSVVTKAGETWVGRQGPITFDSLYHGEHYDARMELDGWDSLPLSSFPSNTFGPSTAMSPMTGELTPVRIPPSTVAETLTPVNATRFSVPGSANNFTTVYDFGRNGAGYATLAVSGPAGAIVSMLFGEILYWDGHVQNTYDKCNTTGPNQEGCAIQTDVYILKGDGLETWTPIFTYHGYRYMELSVSTGSQSLTHVEVASHLINTNLTRIGAVDMPVVAGTDLGTPDVLNAIQRATFNAQRSQLTLGIITDCPQREKRGWMGDAQVSSLEACMNLDMQAMYRSFLTSVRDNQLYGCANNAVDPCRDPAASVGSLPTVVPHQLDGGFPGSTVWVAAYVVLARQSLRMFGDAAMCDEQYNGLTGLMQWFESVKSPTTGLVESGWLGDWPRMWGRLTPVPAVSAFYWILCLQFMSDIATAVGRPGDAASYAAEAANATQLYHAAFWNATTGGYASNSQTSNIMALKLRSMPAENVSSVAGQLIGNIEARHGHLNAGIIGNAWVFDVLRDLGHDDLILDMLLKDASPSFGWMVNQGATTLWEYWAGNVTQAYGSRNHIMFGGSNTVFYTFVAGMDTNSSWAVVQFHPSPSAIARLPFASASIHTPRGLVSISWTSTPTGSGAAFPKTTTMKLSVPMGSTAEVWLPVASSGSSPSGSMAVMEGGHAVFSNGTFHGGAVSGVVSGVLVTEASGVTSVKMGMLSGEYGFATVGV